MKTELKNKKFIMFLAQVIAVVAIVLSLIVWVNTRIDASQVITTGDWNTQAAKLALDGNVVAVPENYNERVYQRAVVDEMSVIPDTIVIGSSRGMYLGEEITGFDNLYNNCISGACMEDYYALLGLYEQKFSTFPKRVIIETSPWVFFAENPEARWIEDYEYSSSAGRLFKEINGYELITSEKKENPYFSIPYFRYNISVLRAKGLDAFDRDREPARVSINEAEAADYPDGSIRYEAKLENRSESRLEAVKSINGGVTYENVINMTEMSDEDIQNYENLIGYLSDRGTEIIIFMQPFSITQCEYIYEQNTNPAFSMVEEYLHELGRNKGIKVVGGYDSRKYNITDDDFIDFMHLDKAGTVVVWNTDF